MTHNPSTPVNNCESLLSHTFPVDAAGKLLTGQPCGCGQYVAGATGPVPVKPAMERMAERRALSDRLFVAAMSLPDADVERVIAYAEGLAAW